MQSSSGGNQWLKLRSSLTERKSRQHRAHCSSMYASGQGLRSRRSAITQVSLSRAHAACALWRLPKCQSCRLRVQRSFLKAWSSQLTAQSSGRAGRPCWSLFCRITLSTARYAMRAVNANFRMPHTHTERQSHGWWTLRIIAMSSNDPPLCTSTGRGASCATVASEFAEKEWTCGHWGSPTATHPN